MKCIKCKTENKSESYISVVASKASKYMILGHTFACRREMVKKKREN